MLIGKTVQVFSNIGLPQTERALPLLPLVRDILDRVRRRPKRPDAESTAVRPLDGASSRAGIAVVTDTLSAGFYFPAWLDYYSREFGREALHVFAPRSEASKFDVMGLGAVIETPEHYNDNDRLIAITEYIDMLLGTHKWVVRVDTDEFIIADPLYYPNLTTYLESQTKPYVTARGFDIFHHTNDAPLDVSAPIIGLQRCYGFCNTALCKTAVTSIKMRWDRGFHLTSLAPDLDELYLFHLKRADIDMQVSWGEYIARRISNDPFIKAYYETPRQDIEAFSAELSARPCRDGADALRSEVFDEKFRAALQIDPGTGLFTASHFIDLENVRLPERFAGKF